MVADLILYMNSDTCDTCVYCLDSEQPMIPQPLLEINKSFCVSQRPNTDGGPMCVYVCLIWSLHFVVGRIQIN